MVPASSMHGGSHRAQVAGATDACLHARALRESVSAQCTPTPRRCTAWQGMGCEHGARTIHKRAVRWRKHSTRHQRLLPWRSASSSPGFSSNGLDARPVHKCTTSCRLQAAAVGSNVSLSVLAPGGCNPNPCTAFSHRSQERATPPVASQTGRYNAVACKHEPTRTGLKITSLGQRAHGSMRAHTHRMGGV